MFVCSLHASKMKHHCFSFSSSYDGHEEDGGFDGHGETASNGYTASGRVNGGDNSKDAKTISRQIPIWLSASTPDEFVV